MVMGNKVMVLQGSKSEQVNWHGSKSDGVMETSFLGNLCEIAMSTW